MDLSKYEELTGISVSSSQEGKVNAQIKRQQVILEQMLGFTLDPEKTEENLYNELGKTKTDCSCPDVGDQHLDPADEVIGAYRLYNYNPDDEYLHIDPFKQINKVKLVYVRFGESPNGITLREFNKEDNSTNTAGVHYSNGGVTKYLQQCWENICICSCNTCVQLAVDADWLWPKEGEGEEATQNIPDDLLYIWADMVTYYSNPSRRIKSETITSHSYTLTDEVAPELDAQNIATIKKYAGPGGSVMAMPV